MKGFEITGVEEVQKILDDIAPKHARNLMRSTIQGVASEIAKQARRNAPKDTGTLKKSIKAKRKKSPPDRPVSEVYVKSDAFYWRFIEYGSKGPTAQPERPFIRPASEKIRSNFEKILTEQFGKKLEKKLAKEAKKRAKN